MWSMVADSEASASPHLTPKLRYSTCVDAAELSLADGFEELLGWGCAIDTRCFLSSGGGHPFFLPSLLQTFMVVSFSCCRVNQQQLSEVWG